MKEGAVIWICGLAGAGKTSISRGLFCEMQKKYHNVILLDGDVIRSILGTEGYSFKERLKGSRKISNLCSFLSENGLIVICATISLFKEINLLNRKNIKNYYEIFIECSMEELKRRDQKNIYSMAESGKIQNVFGIDIKYDIPDADYILNNETQDKLEEKVEIIYKEIKKFLDKKGL